MTTTPGLLLRYSNTEEWAGYVRLFLYAIEQLIHSTYAKHTPSPTTPTPRRPPLLPQLFTLKSILTLFYIRTLHYCRHTYIHDHLCSLTPEHIILCLSGKIPTVYVCAQVEFHRPLQHQHTSHHMTFPCMYVGSTNQLYSGASARQSSHISALWHHRLNPHSISKSPIFHNSAATLSRFHKLVVFPICFAPHSTPQQLISLECNHFIPTLQPCWNSRPSPHAAPHHATSPYKRRRIHKSCRHPPLHASPTGHIYQQQIYTRTPHPVAPSTILDLQQSTTYHTFYHLFHHHSKQSTLPTITWTRTPSPHGPTEATAFHLIIQRFRDSLVLHQGSIMNLRRFFHSCSHSTTGAATFVSS